MICALITPYADYGNIPKTLFTFTGGDVFSRVMVRVKETFDSLAMLEFALDNMPDTPAADRRL